MPIPGSVSALSFKGHFEFAGKAITEYTEVLQGIQKLLMLVVATAMMATGLHFWRSNSIPASFIRAFAIADAPAG